jgi:hypothetical protein
MKGLDPCTFYVNKGCSTRICRCRDELVCAGGGVVGDGVKFLMGIEAFLYAPDGGLSSKLIRQLTSVKNFRFKLRQLEALPLIANVTLPLTVPLHTPPHASAAACYAGQPDFHAASTSKRSH